MRIINTLRTFAVVSTTLVATSSSNAWAQESHTPPGLEMPIAQRFETSFEKRHERGLYTELGVGLVWGTRQRELDSQTLDREQGIGASLDASLGAHLGHGLVLSGLVSGELERSRGRLAVGAEFKTFPVAQEHWSVGLALGVSSPWEQNSSLGRQLEGFGQLTLGTGMWVGPWSSWGLELVASAHVGDLDADGTSSFELAAGVRTTLGLE